LSRCRAGITIVRAVGDRSLASRRLGLSVPIETEYEFAYGFWMSLKIAGWIEPQQSRSQKSEHRIFDAVERILERKDFEAIAISEIAAAAEISVGNFYARFTSKDALLAALHKRYERDRTQHLLGAFRCAARPGQPLAERIRLATTAIVELFRSRRGVLRSLIFRHWRDPSAANEEFRERQEMLSDELTALMLGAREEIVHPDPERAVHVGLMMLLAICRETIVMRPKALPNAAPVNDDELTRELTHMLHAYLTTPIPQRAT